MTRKSALIFLLTILFMGFAVAQSLAGSSGTTSIARVETGRELVLPDYGATFPLDTTQVTASRLTNMEMDHSFTLPAGANYPQGDQVCRQILANPQLDIVLIDPDTGFAEPWVEFPGEIYFSDEDYVSPFYSLLTVDADPGDNTPTIDGLAQPFFMPEDLLSVTVDFATASINTNMTDEAQGELWTLNPDGTLNQFIDGFIIPDVSGNQWSLWFYDVQPQNIAAMSGQPMALIMLGLGNGADPGEWVFLDDILLTACYTGLTGGPEETLLPAMLNSPSTGPICSPSDENPPDQYNSDRGYVETGATCVSTLAETDKQDYYTYSSAGTDTYRFSLSNLPNGSEWSVTVFEDHDPYNIASGGNCRTTTPGDGNKFVDCNLPGNGNFFVKVSAGNWSSGAAPYTLQITQP